MRKIYFQFYLPFVYTQAKRRILFLAVLSYIALC